MTRYTRNRQLEKLGIKGYVVNVPLPIMIKHHQYENNLDCTFSWERYKLKKLSQAYWERKRFNKKIGKNNWKVRYMRAANYVTYKSHDDMMGFCSIK